MSIRFHCDCGALFEVPDDQAGLAGRCLGCGKQLTIPDDSQILIDIPPASSGASSSGPDTATKPESVHGLYCPFCGAYTGKDAVTCPSCRRTVNQETFPQTTKSPLNTVDWLLVTLLAPSGLLTGFVLLLIGKKKGLDMVGIAAASMLIWWFVFIIMGWIG
jgi:hypothetical protein